MLLDRLKRIEGQVRGIQKMVENGCDCKSVITQLAALRSVIESAGTVMLNNYMKFCLPIALIPVTTGLGAVSA